MDSRPVPHALSRDALRLTRQRSSCVLPRAACLLAAAHEALPGHFAVGRRGDVTASAFAAREREAARPARGICFEPGEFRSADFDAESRRFTEQDVTTLEAVIKSQALPAIHAD